MSSLQLLLVAGTHGNEINAPWLFNEWNKSPGVINTNGLKIAKIIGNPEALKVCKRYIDNDLNRSFRKDLLQNKSIHDYEAIRAREIVDTFGPEGSKSCQIAIDFHSTTSAMGSSIVIYGRRPADLAIASLLQSRLGLPVYLHESDNTQMGFLVESWPCGLVIEIGPVPQGLLHADTIEKTKLVLQYLLDEVVKLRFGLTSFPDEIVIHRHVESIDFPRSPEGQPQAFVHPMRQGADWFPIREGSPLFMKLDGSVVSFKGHDSLVPVFINEAAYAEKKIAMSLTKREVWNLSKDCHDAINYLINDAYLV